MSAIPAGTAEKKQNGEILAAFLVDNISMDEKSFLAFYNNCVTFRSEMVEAES